MNLKTRLRSTAVTRLSSPGFQALSRTRARLADKLKRQPAAVHYFHQVDDPYSHLAIQKLDLLRDAYSLPFNVHLVAQPPGVYLGSAEHFDHWALHDAASIADAYGTPLPAQLVEPDAQAVATANGVLAAHMAKADFVEVAVRVGESLWRGDVITDASDKGDGRSAIELGNAVRKSMGHFLGGMFCFQGEWYWGVDRLRLLEARLIDEGYNRDNKGIRVPEPTASDTTGLQAGHIKLEYFPSLRSPYTAIGHERVLALIARSGVSVEVRPVMPMLMRGVTAPRAKQRYIITDASREGWAHNSPMRKVVDPFGEPVKRAFALFPGALALGKQMEFVTAYLHAAWVDGIDIAEEAGLREVSERAGIDWGELQRACEGSNWETILDDNLQAMLGEGLWGVPSFRVSGGNDEAAFACWGQDRIWRVENEIHRRCSSAIGDPT